MKKIIGTVCTCYVPNPHECKNTIQLENMKTFNLIDYKGKYDIIQDKDIEYDFDIIVGEITREDAIKQAKERVEACRYYGIPAIITKDEELQKIYKELEKKCGNKKIKKNGIHKGAYTD